MKATAISPANIAFIKYWGKKDSKLNLPFNDSISMNIDGCVTTTTIEFSRHYKKDAIYILGVGSLKLDRDKTARGYRIIDLVRKKAGLKLFAKVVTKNNFPANSGIASSASAFSALAQAASAAAGLKLSTKELSILARIGSGSACRSVTDGFAWWKKGKNNNSSYAVQIAKPDFWDLRDIVTVVKMHEKKQSSTVGHLEATSSPYFRSRINYLTAFITKFREAFFSKNFTEFGKAIEEEAVSLHFMAMSSRPPVFYWNKGTIEIIRNLHNWRENGLEGYFTIDAGPSVHVICRAKDVSRLNQRLKKLPEVLYTIVNKPCLGARLSKKHLF